MNILAALLLILRAAGSSHQLLDNLSTLLGILISFLTMFACIEYTYLMLPSGIVSIILNLATMQEHPEQITYLVFSVYSNICQWLAFFRIRKLYHSQQAAERSDSCA